MQGDLRLSLCEPVSSDSAWHVQHDPEATGELDYVKIMALLLDGDNFKMYCAGGPKPAAPYDETAAAMHRRSGRVS